MTLVSAYQSEREVRMSPGDTVSLAGYTLRFGGVERVPGPNYVAVRGSFDVGGDGEVLFTLAPEKRIYDASEMSMTEAAIHTGPLRDLYVSLGDPLEEEAWSVRVYYKPFVAWIWAGAFLAALGGVLALSDRRYRRPPGAP
jgi:cytochrome c-type biogenesis protein CcmF